MRLRSEVELALPTSHDDGWDVDVRWGPDIRDSIDSPPGEVVAIYETGDDAWYTGTATESGYHLRFRSCGEFLISSDLSDVQVRRDPAGPVELLPILLAGTLSAFLLTMRGATVLHASAVAIDGAALAFVGQSGRGKSTLAALMCLDGAQIVTDDVLTVDVGAAVTCLGGASELRLRPAAAPLAHGQPGAVTRETADERLALSAQPAPSGSLPLGAIVVPSPSRTAVRVEVRELVPSTALFWLLAFPRIHGWRSRDVLQRDFAALSALVNRVPVYDVTIPWGPPFDPAVAAELTTLVKHRVTEFSRA
jgi:hypothetical protein